MLGIDQVFYVLTELLSMDLGSQIIINIKIQFKTIFYQILPKFYQSVWTQFLKGCMFKKSIKWCWQIPNTQKQ